MDKDAVAIDMKKVAAEARYDGKFVLRVYPEHSEGTGGQDTQEEPVFERITTPTPLQQRAFELLDVALK